MAVYIPPEVAVSARVVSNFKDVLPRHGGLEGKLAFVADAIHSRDITGSRETRRHIRHEPARNGRVFRLLYLDWSRRQVDGDELQPVCK